MHDIYKSLPLLAAVLGRQHGVEIRIGGKTASTDGRVVNIPAVNLTSDRDTLGLIRGYIDHEAGGHLRFTDFDALQAAGLNPVEKYVWNSIEDWRVETALTDIYPGCAGNLAWLIRKFFVDEWKPSKAPETAIMNYILLTCRSWSLAEVEANRAIEREIIRQNWPQLPDKLDAVLATVRSNCPDTRAAISYARQIVRLIENEEDGRQDAQESAKDGAKQDARHSAEDDAKDDARQGAQQDAKDSAGDNARPDAEEATEDDAEDDTGHNAQQIVRHSAEDDALHDAKDNARDTAKKHLHISEAQLPKDFSERLEAKIESVCKRSNSLFRASMALPAHQTYPPLSWVEKQEALTATAALRHRLQGVMQAHQLRRIAPSRQGSLYSNKLYRVFVNNPRVFKGNAQTREVNTAVHILCDCSGSMAGERIRIARDACFALASSLRQIPGVNLGVSTFPPQGQDTGIVPVLEHGKPMHSNFRFQSSGSTPLTEALLWVTHTLCSQPEPRKILLLVTDGGPDNAITCRQALADARNYVEVYGIGLCTDLIRELLPKSSIVLRNLRDLNSNLFGMIQNCLS